MAKLTPCLWFDTQGEEAAMFYTSIFKDSRITQVARYSDAGPGEPGSAMVVSFELAGQPFVALNGGPHFTFNEAISFQIDCKDQDEVDDFWAKLSDGGSEGQCGWLKDKFGVSWQVVPSVIAELMSDPDPEKATRVATALFQMRKIDIATLRAAADAS